MKAILLFCSLFLIVSFANSRESSYTASTPANETVRKFLGIPLTDSVDFIRWKLVLNDKQYTLNCSYGISQPNTNGFYDGGKKIELSGRVMREKNQLAIWNENKNLKIILLNDDILHLANNDNSLMIGTAGWSYTLNNMAVTGSTGMSATPKATVIKDSMVFTGRSPCGVPGIIAAGKLCYKLKWHIVLYGNTVKNVPTTCKVFGTPYRKEGGKPGTWKIVNKPDGHIRYEVKDEKGNTYLFLEKADENILYFTDAAGKLLAGNEDFSYSLNRMF
jgi:hypothetical protein